jgi:hypothetical protein
MGWKDGAMRHNIVEGEPGIFPDPIARFFRWIFGLFGRSRHKETPEGEGPDDEHDSDSASGA